jgi:hypothetical protein
MGSSARDASSFAGSTTSGSVGVGNWELQVLSCH